MCNLDCSGCRECITATIDEMELGDSVQLTFDAIVTRDSELMYTVDSSDGSHSGLVRAHAIALLVRLAR